MVVTKKVNLISIPAGICLCLQQQTFIFLGTTTTNCEVQPQYVYESNIHAQNVLATLNEQRKNGLLCDMTVIVDVSSDM